MTPDGSSKPDLAPIRPVRILHVSQPGEAGVARVVAGLAAFQAAAGLEVVVAGPSNSWLSEEIGVPISYAPWEAARSPVRGILAERRRLRAIVTRVRPDVVHLHSSKAGLVGRLAIRGRLPTVFQPHAWSFSAMSGIVGLAAELWERIAAMWTTQVICLSQEEQSLGAGIGITRSTKIPNGVDTTYWYPRIREDARKRLGISADISLVLCVGRLAEQKGQLAFAPWWRTVTSRVDGATLALVGAGPDEAQIRAAYRGSEVLFDTTCADTRDWLAACDLLVAPSIWEGAALAPLEAMAMARAVVGYDVGGLAEVLGEDGLTAAPRDGAALSDAIVASLADLSLGERLRERVARNYDAKIAYGSFTEIAECAARTDGHMASGIKCWAPKMRSH